MRSFCWSKSKRNADAFDLVEEYSVILNLTKADTISFIMRDYGRLKNKERYRELQSMGLT